MGRKIAQFIFTATPLYFLIMSNRRVQHIFGEGSLEVKCLTLFALCMVVVILVTMTPIWWTTKQLIDLQNPQTGRLLVDEVVLIKHWEGFEPNENFQLVRRVVQSQLTQQKFEYHVLKPGRTYESLDEFGQQTVEKFAQAPIEQFRQASNPLIVSTSAKSDDSSESNPETSDGSQKRKETPVEKTTEPDYIGRLHDDNYEYYQAVRAQRSCITGFCHPELQPQTLSSVPSSVIPGGGVLPGLPSELEPEDAPDGKLMAVVKVIIPQGRMQRLINKSFNILVGVAITMVFLGLIAFNLTIRSLIIKPLKYLRDVADAVYYGNNASRAELTTGDEFEALSIAINRMLRRIFEVHAKLQKNKDELDERVSELANLTMQLRETNRVKSDFLSTMSHELRTPLNSIIGFSDVLSGIEQLDARQKKYVTNIQNSGKLLLSMINDILDLAKMDSGKMLVNISEFQIEKIVSAQCDMARPLAEKKNLALIEEIAPDLPPIEQDQNRLQQALNNLLSNAIKFTPEGGTVKVIVNRDVENNMLLLSVSDTGIGIAEEEQKTIFEKFRQGSSANSNTVMTREYAGTGLGLSIVKEICKLLQGEITLESKLAVGSTFTIRVPWKLEAAPQKDASPLTLELEAFSKSPFDRSKVLPNRSEN